MVALVFMIVRLFPKASSNVKTEFNLSAEKNTNHNILPLLHFQSWLISIAGLGFGVGLGHRFQYYADI